MTSYDYFALFLFLLLFFGYHYAYFFISHTLKKETREHRINIYREHWLDIVIQKNEPVFAIQTIRNLIMTNTFLVSLAMIMMGGLISALSANLNLIQTLESISAVNRSAYYQYFNDHPIAIKILLGIFMLLIAAYNFTIALRILYNLNFTAGAVTKLPEEREFQREQLRRQARHFITGIRSLYYFFGPMLWILNTTIMIVFTIFTTVAFLRFDFLPRRKGMADYSIQSLDVASPTKPAPRPASRKKTRQNK